MPNPDLNSDKEFLTAADKEILILSETLIYLSIISYHGWIVRQYGYLPDWYRNNVPSAVFG